MATTQSKHGRKLDGAFKREVGLPTALAGLHYLALVCLLLRQPDGLLQSA